ncbi:hypothetical protein PR002_g21775 [Phytophthora rubi]|uniref:Secreted protein n=1 Tax=Phytophthora rubi TaxID=129364 RepID=A0A6A3IZH0_9STRA|nr:hypothetical protein PR002_g21775 [Phytophthora rubi]
MRRNWNSPLRVVKAVLALSSSATPSSQYPACRSKLVKHLEPYSASSVSSTLGNGYTSLIVTAFRAR